MADPDKAWALVHEAILAFGTKVPDLGKARAALLRVIREEAWKHYTPPIGEPCDPPSFQEWVVAKVPRGLETTVENLQQIAQGDTELADALDHALQNPVGRHRDSDNIRVTQSSEDAGTSRDYALRRLRKRSPELHADVLAGRLSAHAAMVQAGYRPRTISVRVQQPESVARSLRKHMAPDDLARLAELLREQS